VFVTVRAYPDMEKKMREMIRDNSKAWIVPLKTIWPKHPSIERLSEIKARTLIIVGDKDNENILGVADVLNKKIAGSQKMVLVNTGHHMNMEEPQQFNTIVLQFLRGESPNP
jgi:pimeloyl-ACP methyl ester carboxylesterase